MVATSAKLTGACVDRPDWLRARSGRPDYIAGGFTGIAQDRGPYPARRVCPGGAPNWNALARHKVLILGGGVAGLAAARPVPAWAGRLLPCWAGRQCWWQRPRWRGEGDRLPTGAHYLPVPGDNAPEVQVDLHWRNWARQLAGWTLACYEATYCHSPKSACSSGVNGRLRLLPVQGVR